MARRRSAIDDARRAASKNTRIFIMKASTAARTAINRGDCGHADYWLRQIELRTNQKAPKRLKGKLLSCYRRKDNDV